MGLDRTVHGIDGWTLESTYVAWNLRFLSVVSIFNLPIVLAAYLQKTGGFALQWPLARAKFASVFETL